MLEGQGWQKGTHLDGEEDVDGADDVVLLREDGARAIDHGVWRRALLAKVHDRVWLKCLESLREELEVADVAHLQVDVLPRDLSPPVPHMRFSVRGTLT